MPSVEVAARGLRYPEGPAFDRSGRLFVVELGGSRVSLVTGGTRETFADTGGAPNGSTFGPDGALYVANNGGMHPPATSTDGKPGPGGSPAAIQRVSGDGAVETILTEIDGRTLNSPNDLCFDAAGNLWFTDPIWEGPADDPVPQAPIACLGADGVARRIDTVLRFPNGIGFAPDGSWFIVSESSTGGLWRFDVEAPGVVSEPRPWGTLGAGALPDGFAFDEAGCLLVAGHGTNAIHVFTPDGIEESRIDLGEGSMPSNLAFGGPDRTEVSVTAANLGELLTFTWRTPGLVLFGDR